MNSFPLVSIITVNHNQVAATVALLESLTAITYPNIEVVVVDNGSLANDAARIAQAASWAKVVSSPTNLGFAGGCNLGLAVAKGEMLLFLNNDVEVAAGFLEPLVEQMHKPGVGMVSPKIRFYHNPEIIQYAGATPLCYITMRNRAIGFAERDMGQYDKPYRTSFAHGAAMMTSREVVSRVGLMYEGFFLYYEEMDWCERISRAGYTIMYEPASVVFHKESASVGKSSPQKAYYLNRNRLLFLKRNASGLTRALGIAYFWVVAAPKRLVLSIIGGQGKHRKALVRSLLWHLNPKPNEYVS